MIKCFKHSLCIVLTVTCGCLTAPADAQGSVTWASAKADSVSKRQGNISPPCSDNRARKMAGGYLTEVLLAALQLTLVPQLMVVACHV
jgi:hypothetical protein